MHSFSPDKPPAPPGSPPAQELVDNLSAGRRPYADDSVKDDDEQDDLSYEAASMFIGPYGRMYKDLLRVKNTFTLSSISDGEPTLADPSQKVLDNCIPKLDTVAADLLFTHDNKHYPQDELDYAYSYAFQSEQNKWCDYEYGIDAFIHSSRFGFLPSQSLLETSPTKAPSCPLVEGTSLNELDTGVILTGTYSSWHDPGTARQENGRQNSEAFVDSALAECLKRASAVAEDLYNGLESVSEERHTTLNIEDAVADVNVMPTLPHRKGVKDGDCALMVGVSHLMAAWRANEVPTDGLPLFTEQRERGTRGLAMLANSVCALKSAEGPSSILRHEEVLPLHGKDEQSSGTGCFIQDSGVMRSHLMSTPTLSGPVCTGSLFSVTGVMTESECGPKRFPCSQSLLGRRCADPGWPTRSSPLDSLMEGMEYPFLGRLRSDLNMLMSSPSLCHQSVSLFGGMGELSLSTEEAFVSVPEGCGEFLKPHVRCSVQIQQHLNHVLIPDGSSTTGDHRSFAPEVAPHVLSESQVIEWDAQGNEEKKRCAVNAMCAAEGMDEISSALEPIGDPSVHRETNLLPPSADSLLKHQGKFQSNRSIVERTGALCASGATNVLGTTVLASCPSTVGTVKDRPGSSQGCVRSLVLNHKVEGIQNDTQVRINLCQEGTLEICPAHGRSHFFKVDEYLECTDNNNIYSVTLSELRRKLLSGMNTTMFLSGSESVSMVSWRSVCEVVKHVFRGTSSNDELFMAAVFIREGLAQDLLSESRSVFRTNATSVPSLHIALDNVKHTKLEDIHHFTKLLSQVWKVFGLGSPHTAGCIVTSIKLTQVRKDSLVPSSLLVVGGPTSNDLSVLFRRNNCSEQQLIYEALSDSCLTVTVATLCEGDKDLVQLMNVHRRIYSVAYETHTVRDSIQFVGKGARDGVVRGPINGQRTSEQKKSFTGRTTFDQDTVADLRTFPQVGGVKELRCLVKDTSEWQDFGGRSLSRPRSSSEFVSGRPDRNDKLGSGVSGHHGVGWEKSWQEGRPRTQQPNRQGKHSAGVRYMSDTSLLLPPSCQRTNGEEHRLFSRLPGAVTSGVSCLPREHWVKCPSKTPNTELRRPLRLGHIGHIASSSASDTGKEGFLALESPFVVGVKQVTTVRHTDRSDAPPRPPLKRSGTSCQRRLPFVRPAQEALRDVGTNTTSVERGRSNAGCTADSATSAMLPDAAIDMKEGRSSSLPFLPLATPPGLAFTPCLPSTSVSGGPPTGVLDRNRRDVPHSTGFRVRGVQPCVATDNIRSDGQAELLTSGGADVASCELREGQCPLRDSNKPDGISPTWGCEHVGHACGNKGGVVLAGEQNPDGCSDDSVQSMEACAGHATLNTTLASSKVQTLVVIDQPPERRGIITSDGDTVFLNVSQWQSEYRVDEVVVRPCGCNNVSSRVLRELQDAFLRGCNAAIIMSEGNSSGVPSIVMGSVVQDVLSGSASVAHQGYGRRLSLSVSIVQLTEDSMVDLLRADSTPERLVTAISPIFGPCVHNASRLPVGSCSAFDSMLTTAFLRAARDEGGRGLVLVSMVLKQKLEVEGDVLVSSLTVSVARGDTDVYLSVLNRSLRAPRALFHYALGGPCYTVALVSVSENSVEADRMLHVQRSLGEVVNRPIHRGSIIKFISGIRDDLVPSLRKKLQRSGSCESPESILCRLEEMVRDAMLLLGDFEANEPRAYLSDAEMEHSREHPAPPDHRAVFDTRERIRSLVFFEQRLLSGGYVNVHGRSVLTHTGDSSCCYDVDEVVLRGPDISSGTTLCSHLVDELVRRFMSGHCTALLAADSRNSASTPLILRNIVHRVLRNKGVRAGCAPALGDLLVSMALVRNNNSVDLLVAKEGSTIHPVEVEISPLLDRRLRGVSYHIVESAEIFDRLLATAVDRAEPALRTEDPGMMVISLNLAHGVQEPVRNVFVSSLMVTTVFDRVSHYHNILLNRPGEPAELFGLALGGPCYTVAALGLCDEDEDTNALLSVLMKLAQVRNRPSRPMGVLQRVEELKKVIQTLGTQLDLEGSDEKKAYIRVKIAHARRFLQEGEALLRLPLGGTCTRQADRVVH